MLDSPQRGSRRGGGVTQALVPASLLTSCAAPSCPNARIPPPPAPPPSPPPLFRNRRSTPTATTSFDASQCSSNAALPSSPARSVLDGSLLAVDVRPLVVHVLHGLAWAGITRAVVVLGVGAEKLVESVRQEEFTSMSIEFLFGVEINWGSSLANNIMAARTAFVGDEPLCVGN